MPPPPPPPPPPFTLPPDSISTQTNLINHLLPPPPPPFTLPPGNSSANSNENRLHLHTNKPHQSPPDWRSVESTTTTTNTIITITMVRPNTARNRARARARKMILESPNCPPAVQNAGRVTAAMETALRGVIDPMYAGNIANTTVRGAALAGAQAAAATWPPNGFQL
ncbi:uncharacterized protein K444DRAFT_635975 [Hyaloscypha bicolor E]|uniref:Uncharacterized protein n=1 Tax=Hyaloscypha bicolor E TaxID=1095630 RepID=A0A2J6SQK9_9HELO|nr:uncharacterized protein K444DRAFT_635975 [Hyaloscypha bicolor E]PMD53066.1 hypothetical protein K444DRAFT_635975 [Hyaloscypha bicolor E]